ncbi:MAG TPA: DAK2 domain-containing protein [Candidatus Limnocylindria bacterium]|nr:DAK2 domain-containing protein [Candidatus Limnocylindria bacterium]
MAGSSEAFVDLLEAVARVLPEHRDELNRLDGVAGDGDLGLTVEAACRALVELAPELRDLPEAEAIGRCGREIARRAPSTGGTLVAFAFMAAGKAGVDPDAPGVARAAGYLDAAATSVAQRGQVSVGDRTMLDALRPAADALLAAADAGGGPTDGVAAAGHAAEAGAKATASMAAKVGRAGWLADRAAGNEDAGARLVAFAVDSAARHVGGLRE